ncbi:MAG: ribonuclease III [Candidatus Peregrinibacteria bacterium]
MDDLFLVLDYIPQNIELFRVAVTHKSFTNENGGSDNERLEFLGDAVLEFLTTDFLFHTFPHMPEGEMTAIRSALVRKESLAAVAEKMELGKYIRFSRGEKSAGGQTKSYILANTLEAVLGAVFLDGGMPIAKKVVETFILCQTEEIYEKNLHIGPKNAFQEFSQAKFSITPHYELLSSEGPDHGKTFTMGVFMGQKKIAEGKGSSKQKAESDAAKNALQITQKENPSS